MIRVRDLLQWVTMAAVLLGFGAVCRYVHPYAALAFIGLGVAAWLLRRSRTRQPARWLLNTLAVLVVVVSALRVSPDYLVEPILEGILLLVAIKLLEARLPRDYLQIHALCVFQLLGSALISLSMVFLLFFIPLAFLLTVSLILLTFEAADQDPHLPRPAVLKIFAQAGLICLLSVPIMVVIFVILPRTNYPILMFLNQSGSGHTGFSERVQLGEVAAIQEDNSVVFRAAMAVIDPDQLYWRGIVLDHFDGVAWTRSDSAERPYGAVRVDGRPVQQTIYLEPYGNKFLFGLDKPIKIQGRSAARGEDLTYQERHGIFQRIRYQVDSMVGAKMQVENPDQDYGLQLPPNIPEELRQLADRLGAGLGPREKVAAFVRYLRGGQFRYALSELPVSDQPLADFLLRHHQGNCEYFAASLAVLLRLGGIPSRLVGGYKGGYYNSTGGYYLVLQKHAHIWTEAYLNDLDWVRLDPTPAAGLQPADLYLRKFLTQARLLTDVLNYYWFRLIVDYDFQQQLQFLHRAREAVTTQSWRPWLSRLPLARALAVFVGLAALGLAGWELLRRRRRDPAVELAARFRARLGRRGYRMKPSEGLEEFVARIDSAPLQGRALAFVLALEPYLYGGQAFQKAHYRRLAKQLRDL